ncbi:MAG TPA: glycosyltransferase, partial [Candidatus Dormibacteraeota bacterium]|nr:glycosyltransferase [Candidatus Dormibacteraeota bacterium]
MKVLLLSHPLELGGSQVCAIDLAAALRDRHGHDVVILGAPGPAEELVARRGLRHIPAPAASTHPSPAVIRGLRAVVREERPDVVHAWDWPQILDA